MTQHKSRKALMAETKRKIRPGRLPRAVRISLVLSLVLLICGAGFVAYRDMTKPKTLTIAAGSFDNYVPKFVSAIAAKLAANNAPVRLKLVEKDTPLEAFKAFKAGEVDLAVGRADVLDFNTARAIVLMTHSVVMIVSLTADSIKEMADLKGKTIGVVNPEVNREVVSVISKTYDLEQAKVRFRDLPPREVMQAVQGRQVQALLVVLPISTRYLGMLRDVFPRNGKLKPGLVPIESAGAIAALNKAYESFDLPKGTLRASPPIPDEDVTTLRVPAYMVARKTLDDAAAEALAKAVMEVRRELIAEYPLLANMGAPDTDKDAFVPVHPGAAAYFDGDSKTVFDKYGDQMFYGSMLLGSLMSILAAVWRFVSKGNDEAPMRPSVRLYELMDQITGSKSGAELTAVESDIDEILKDELERYASSGIDAGEMAALGLATHRLEYAIAQRRLTLST